MSFQHTSHLLPAKGKKLLYLSLKNLFCPQINIYMKSHSHTICSISSNCDKSSLQNKYWKVYIQILVWKQNIIMINVGNLKHLLTAICGTKRNFLFSTAKHGPELKWKSPMYETTGLTTAQYSWKYEKLRSLYVYSV